MSLGNFKTLLFLLRNILKYKQTSSNYKMRLMKSFIAKIRKTYRVMVHFVLLSYSFIYGNIVLFMFEPPTPNAYKNAFGLENEHE